MAEAVAGLLTSAIVKIVSDKLRFAISEQANYLAGNFNDDLEEMKDAMESMAVVFKDAEKQSIRNESVRLWLKRLKNAALDISDMLDEYQDNDAQAAAKTPGMFSCLTAQGKKMVLANRTKDIRGELMEINKQGQTFKFAHSTSASQEPQHYDHYETASDVNEEKVLGWDREKKEIIDILSGRHKKDGTMVLPIYGLGGMGKSTLAQLVYNDTQFKQYYDHRAWVCVSQEFDLKKIGRSIISQLSTDGGQHNTDTLQIQQCLDDMMLHGKKVLIVLDNIWEEDVSKLEKLKTMLHVDKKGNTVDVIVTTRSESIAKKICTNEPHKVSPLNDVCLDRLKRSSGFEHKSNKQKLEQIGLEIANKCGGVVLAAQALGYMLKTKDLHGWSEMNNSDIWNESSEVDNSQHMKVLSSLQLCYEGMLPTLRLCFSYCAIFPKGHDIHEDDLIHQWLALDFIKKPSEGKEFIKQLLGMSFLQHSKLPLTSDKCVVRYSMHDLVHDLAISVIGDELIVIDAGQKSYTSEQKYCRYVLLKNYDEQIELLDILPKNIRALHFSSSSKLPCHDGSFSFAKSLRILDFSECSGILLSSSVGQLELKCLIAPKMQNENLPNFISELTKLQYLNLRGSSLIFSATKSIGKLGCLKYFDLCSLITELPSSLGNLTNLQHLDLSKCSNVKALPEALCSLTQLQYLNLSFCSRLERIPEAIGFLLNLQYFSMSNCWKIKELPESFINLRNLLYLDLKRGQIVKGLEQALPGLTALQYLDISGNWKDLNDVSIHDAMKNLTHLKYLGLSRKKPGLSGIMLEGGCWRVDFIGTLTNLEHLDISCNIWLEYLPESIGNLKKLHTLDVSHCLSLKSLPDSISEITLKSLLIEGCRNELKDLVNSKFHYSLPLPFFKVRADAVSAHSNIRLLEGVNVSELRIFSLGNVRSLEEASEIKMSDKNNLSELILSCSWEGHSLDQKDLLGQLEPPRGLKSLGLECYSSPSFPSWLMGISHHLPNLVRITLNYLPECYNLPPLGQLPNLKVLYLMDCPRVKNIDKDFCGGKGAFRRLSEFCLRRMEALEEWSTTYSVEDGLEEFMFPMLDELEIDNCPSLRLKPRPPVFRNCIIQWSDQVIFSLEELGNNIGRLNSTPSSRLSIRYSMSRSMTLFHHFPALQDLEISICPNLTSVPEGLRNLTSLQSLELWRCESISALPLDGLYSLESLCISECKSIKSFRSCIRQLTKLQTLRIVRNPELKRWCELEENKKKLAHIKHIDFYSCEGDSTNLW